jgi:hypothetical protein
LGRRRRACALASVRRSNCTCGFPACSFCRRLPGHVDFTTLHGYYAAARLLTSIARHFACAYRSAYSGATRRLCQFSEVTRCSSVLCRPQTPWCGGSMRTPSSWKSRLDTCPTFGRPVHPGFPIDYGASPLFLLAGGLTRVQAQFAARAPGIWDRSATGRRRAQKARLSILRSFPERPSPAIETPNPFD